LAEEKEKAIEKDQKTIPPAGAKKDELSNEDVEKVVGGYKDGEDGVNRTRPGTYSN